MHPARVVHLPGLHPRAIGRHDPPQLRYRQVPPVFRQQPGGAQPAAPVAPVARNLQNWEPVSDLTNGDDVAGHGARLPRRIPG